MRKLRDKDILETFGRVKKMSYGQFHEFMYNYGYANYENGVEFGNREAVTWFESELYDTFVANGIDEEVAQKVIDILLSKEEAV